MNQTPKSFLTACVAHLSVAGEGIGLFREQYKRLTPEDRTELRAQFKTEFGYEFEENAAGPAA